MHHHRTAEPVALVDKLLNQAAGDTRAEAAVMILAEAVPGRLLDAVTLAFESDDRPAIDWDTTRTTTGYLSGGERRLLALADFFASGQPADLSDVLVGLDTGNREVVVKAIAHAVGFHGWGYDR